ncbi:S66 peptidase family protein [Longimicrobium terrae]|uniref:Muramoyltetrapeptide carboxypeptidase n=1 Tax=Longimicrobium terrae TaxID=1639882 RepID=A0A841GZG3_9BACT|nr:LD-carboxypeptidase [Longimicrobium terrae]MBB4636407.1 muramoyltetrapeptide carboxypeptidase [Longimicrobium terrae]MBB6071069.1 muramoyltetrapeptide carboxypeptidase [Longimicrobium terrae]NNC29090.1 LD-carboxypeptidase [Longimicrobium terrae]
MIRPRALRAGSRIALVAGAGPIPQGSLARAVDRVRGFGWEPVPGASAEARHGYLAGPDEARAADLNAALADPSIDAIWFLRGGYGTMRILEAVDWTALSRHPKALIGFSDNTAVHLAAQRAGVVSFHGPHPHTPEFPDFARDTFYPMMTRAVAAGVLPFPADSAGAAETVTGGVAEGPLVGGNLALLTATLGTPYAVRAEGAILFIEDVGEHAFRLDRMLTHLRLSGVLKRVAGIAVGAFSEQPDAGDQDVPLALELARERLGDLGVPVAMGFPFGHVDDNWTLPLGVRARLDADRGTLELLEPAVAE